MIFLTQKRAEKRTKKKVCVNFTIDNYEKEEVKQLW